MSDGEKTTLLLGPEEAFKIDGWSIQAHKPHADIPAPKFRVREALTHAAPLLYLTMTSTMITLIAQIFNDQVNARFNRIT